MGDRGQHTVFGPSPDAAPTVSEPPLTADTVKRLKIHCHQISRFAISR